MLVTMAMHESHRSTSPLPLPKKNFNMSMSLNSYITHPTGAGSRGLQPHLGVPLDQALSLWVCGTVDCSISCHNYCKAENDKYYDYFIKTTHPHSKGNKLKLYI